MNKFKVSLVIITVFLLVFSLMNIVFGNMDLPIDFTFDGTDTKLEENMDNVLDGKVSFCVDYSGTYSLEITNSMNEELEFSIVDTDEIIVYEKTDDKSSLEFEENYVYVIQLEQEKISDNKVHITLNCLDGDLYNEDPEFIMENNGVISLEKISDKIKIHILEDGEYDLTLTVDDVEVPFSIMYEDGECYIDQSTSKEKIMLRASMAYIIQLPEKNEGYNNIKLCMKVKEDTTEISESQTGGNSGGSSSSSSDGNWEDNTYRDAYNAIHDEDGKLIDGWRETYAGNLLYNPNNSGYNGIATATGGKIPGVEYNFPPATTASEVQKINLTPSTYVIAMDGKGTEGNLGYNYTAPILGFVVGENGINYVKVSIVNDTGANESKLIPLGELSADEQARLITMKDELVKSEENLIEVDAPDGTAKGHISMSQSYITFTNIPGVTSTEVSSDEYDISKGIPTSEYIKIKGTAPKALYNIVVRKTTIKAWNDPVNIKAHAEYYYWCHHYKKRRKNDWYCYYHHVATGSASAVCIKNYTDSQQKTFYDVVTSNIYRLESMTITETNETYSKYVLDKTVSMDGKSGPGPQTLTFDLKRPYIEDYYDRDYEGHVGWAGYGSAYNKAKASSGSSGKAAVRNALTNAINASVKGSVNYSWEGLHVSKMSYSGSPNPGFSTVEDKILIPETYPNGRYNPDGYFTYAGYGKLYNVPEHVYVHTPVVNDATITSTSKFVNQKVNAESSKLSSNYYLMLDESFTITISDKGIHRSIQGYYTRLYNSKQGRNGNKTATWGKVEEAKFPFDVYVHGKSGKKYFLPAGKWMSEESWWSTALNDITTISGTASDRKVNYTFTIPVWVKEQVYKNESGNAIQVRVVAENAFGDKNIDNVNHLDERDKVTINTGYNIGPSSDIYRDYVALKTIDCEVIGKIYDLRISASNDPGWQNQILSAKTKKEYITAEEFPFGQQGQNRVTQYKYAPKLGYTFVFDFKTKGRKSNNIDVSVQPEGFYFVGKNGGTVQEVDLYYNTTMKKNIKITTGDNNTNISVKLRDAFLKVAAQEFVDSNRIYALANEIGRVYNYNLGVNIGTFAKMNLPHSLRLCYNNFTEYVNALYGKGSTENSISGNAVTRDNVIGSVGHWYAGYRLPASTMAVTKGANIETAIRNNTLLKDGYIVVKFNIVTKSPKNNIEDPIAGEIGNNYLKYLGPEALNEGGDNTGVLIRDWTKSGTQEIILPNGNRANVPIGSVAIYEVDLRSSNDAEVAGTH